MGDEGWIRSRSSLRYLRQQVKRGDLFFCYESDRKLLVGATRAASDGRDLGQASLVDFYPPRLATRFERPLRRRPDLDHILAFTPQRGRGTIQPIEPDEVLRLVALLKRHNPTTVRRLRRWLQQSRRPNRRGSRRAVPPDQTPQDIKARSPFTNWRLAQGGRNSARPLRVAFPVPAGWRSRQSGRQ